VRNYLRDKWAWLTIRRGNRAYRRLAERYVLPGGYQRVYCYHIRRTGGTSLHRSFMALGDEDPAEVHDRLASSPGNRTVSNGFAFVAHSSELLADGWYFYGWSHLPAHEIRLPSNTFSVSILRDPVQRVCSHYQMLLYGTEGTYPFPHSPEEARLAESGLDYFLSSVPREDLLRQLFMFSKTFDVDEAVERLHDCSHVFQTENYEESLAELAVKLDLPLKMRRERMSASHYELSSGHRERLRELLEPEYEMIARLPASVRTNL
jgi:hypothetical protein